MIALVTFAFLASALALPGLVVLVTNGATETRCPTPAAPGVPAGAFQIS